MKVQSDRGEKHCEVNVGSPTAMNESKTHYQDQLNSQLSAGCIGYLHYLLLSLLQGQVWALVTDRICSTIQVNMD